MTYTPVSKYTLLQEILSLKNLELAATYTIRDVAKLFGVSVRSIQSRVASGQLASRDLPGRAKFLPTDIESFLAASRKDRGRRVR